MEGALGSPSSGGGARRTGGIIRPVRSSSRLSIGKEGGNRSSDEEAKTAVRVAVRIRPPLSATDPGFDLIPQRFRGSVCQVLSDTSLAVESTQGKKVFVFDRVFGQDVDQEGVWDYVSDSVGSFLQGYNVSLLAYGQSGAGKSYTVGTTGSAEQSNQELAGIIPRAATTLFQKLATTDLPGKRSVSQSNLRSPAQYSTSTASPGSSSTSFKPKSTEKSWQLKASYVEIYNEQLRDLLVSDSVPQSERSQISIREDTKGNIILTGLTHIPINSADDLLNALNFGSSIRQTDSTSINAMSSRSHAVFSLNLMQKRSKMASPPASQAPQSERRSSVPLELLGGADAETWMTVESKLHFVDLAGSERMKNTGAQGERAREGISINAGLASLGKVITQLSTRTAGSHVSYRDSRLTRLLQDSLGGNAITYMVACVTPAEFYLNETLNTLQYAQRARAIQSKPRIQQVPDEKDKQAVIDRLRAEVSFLRDQVRLSERSERRGRVSQERSDKEFELQNQLLDIQENYTALSQRHAKLISDITKARGNEIAESASLDDFVGDSAVERLKRSNSFAEAVEHVVLEYEKTIQSLESSLANTRSSLSTSESSLLEKETRVAYLETVQQQLQSRVQKALDRESSTEAYLKDLEMRLEGTTTGSEKQLSVVQDLRKELGRLRDNEATAEDYISTLEDRLAEAEQDLEIMQREIDRLELVVDRQRSVGKLDKLLHELEQMREDGNQPETVDHAAGKLPNGDDLFFTPQRFSDQVSIRDDSPIKNSETKQWLDAHAEDEPAGANKNKVRRGVSKSMTVGDARSAVLQGQSDEWWKSPAQSTFLADKLEAVTQELFDLRVEHETTVSDYGELSRKYQMALRTLAELQDAADGARQSSRARSSTPSTSRPQTPPGATGTNEVEAHGRPSISGTLSSELSSLNESTIDEDIYDSEPATSTAIVFNRHHRNMSSVTEIKLAQEVEILKRLGGEKESRMAELRANYAELETYHKNTLDQVEDLRTELQKASSPPQSPVRPQVVRRASNQKLAADRANRSFATLRNIAKEHLNNHIDAMQVFEVSLNGAISEMQSRSERIQSQESEIADLRKEMQAKSAMIAGLTRERATMGAGPQMDMSALVNIQNQLVERQNEIRTLHETHATREQQLMEKIQGLQVPHDSTSEPERPMPGSYIESLTPNEHSGESERMSERKESIVELQREISGWSTRRQSFMESMSASEQKLIDTISELEATMKGMEPAALRLRGITQAGSAGPQTVGQDRSGEASAESIPPSSPNSVSDKPPEKQLQLHRDLITNLERQIDQYKSATSEHQRTIESLREQHARDIEEAQKTQLPASAEDDALQSLQTEHSRIQAKMTSILAGASSALGRHTDAENLEMHIRALGNERRELMAKHQSASEELRKTQEELRILKVTYAGLQSKHDSLSTAHQETKKELERVRANERQSARLVQELEEQLNQNYDENREKTHRLSVLQNEQEMKLQDALKARFDVEKELDQSRSRIGQLESQLADSKRTTLGSHRSSIDHLSAAGIVTNVDRGTGNVPHLTLRKSHSNVSLALPSPPPAIPLPPLPPTPSIITNNNMNHNNSPSGSRHTSKEIAQNMQHMQAIEELETRIRTVEKHLYAEKQLTATLEEALVDLEYVSSKQKGDIDAFKRRAATAEEEAEYLRRARGRERQSLQQVEEERERRIRAEEAQRRAEEAMRGINKKKKNPLICF